MKEDLLMEIDADALKNFKNSKFNFVDENGKDVNYDNLSDDVKYVFRDGKEVVQDNMSMKMLVDTINNEFGKETNV